MFIYQSIPSASLTAILSASKRIISTDGTCPALFAFAQEPQESSRISERPVDPFEVRRGASDKITACGSPVEIDDVYRIVANIRVQIEIAARQPNRILTDEAR